MQNRYTPLIALFSFVIILSGAKAAQSAPLHTTPVATTSSSTTAPTAPQLQAAPSPAPPAQLIIPSIQLNSTIDALGLNRKGEMDVPNGSSSDVGWYAAGTIPGMRGSAVLDAHVFAAFSNLNKLKAGDDIYVVTKNNQKLRFIVSKTKTYALSDVPAQTLFNRDDAKRLNLITCAGELTADHLTYDHRLIVYAILAH